MDREHLVDLPDIQKRIAGRPGRFIVFCDDLAFDEGDPGYRALKVALDGSLAAPGDNLLIYATSNRRHLVPEYLAENARSTVVEGEIHPDEAIDEKIALSERFGLWLSFYPFAQDEYLAAVAEWLAHYGHCQLDDAARRAALQWALMRGARSGRVASQFARDYVAAQSRR